MQTLKSALPLVFKPGAMGQGQGVNILRIINGQKVPDLDPFVLLDYAHMKLPAGFAEHPHRGFVAVSYITKGTVHHEDIKGHKGVVKPGGVQWMTAGKGIVHAETPGSYEEETVGFQLWVNLRAQDKNLEPFHQGFQNQQIPRLDSNAANIKVLTGSYGGVKGPINTRTPIYFFDVAMKGGEEKLTLDIPKNWNSLVFVHEGDSISYNEQHTVKLDEAAVLDNNGSHLFSAKKPTKFILISGQPLNEPVAKGGPFVMNTEQEIAQAFEDLKGQKNGFENAKVWKSVVRETVRAQKH